MTDFSAKAIVALSLLACSAVAGAQDVRYSWFEIAFVKQDVDRDGVAFDPDLVQTVSISGTDGSGTKFRGSVGTWNNLFAFVDFSSSDIDISALVENAQGSFPADDEFDFSSARAGIGVKWSLTPTTDMYGAVSFDSTGLDFGSFAGEDFDLDDTDIGGELGIRSIFKERLELRAAARYTGVGDVDLDLLEFDTDTLFSVGFGYELIRGLSITGDYESGEFQSWSIGFRLDLDED